MLRHHTVQVFQKRETFIDSCQSYHKAISEAGKSNYHMKESVIKNLTAKLDIMIQTSQDKNVKEGEFLKKAAELKVYFNDAVRLIGTRRSIIGSIKDTQTKQTSLNTILASYVADKDFYNTLEHYAIIAKLPKSTPPS